MGGRISARVGFSLDNPAADPVDKQGGSDQIAGDRHRITSEEGPGQRCFHSPLSVEGWKS
jgi:hypothetical protein